MKKRKTKTNKKITKKITKLPEPKDVILRHSLSRLSDKEITKQIKNNIQNINRKLKRLEKSGFSQYNFSYKRIKEFTKSNLKSEYFSSKTLRNAGREQRMEFLVLLKHYNTNMLNTKETIKMLDKQAEALENRISGDANVDLNYKSMMQLYDRLDYYKEIMSDTEVYKEFGSPEMIEYFAIHINYNDDSFKTFVDAATNPNLSNEDFLILRETFDWNLGVPVKYEEITGAAYNPINNKMYDSYYEETDYEMSQDGAILTEKGEKIDYHDFLKNTR